MINSIDIFWNSDFATILHEDKILKCSFSSDDLTESATELFEYIKAQLGEVESVDLYLPSNMVYFANIPADNLPKKNINQALGFALEDLLPFDTEELTTEFQSNTADSWLAYAVKTQQIKDIVDSLECAGLYVGKIKPTIEKVLASKQKNNLDFLLFQQEEGSKSIELVQFASGKPSNIYSIQNSPAEINRLLNISAINTSNIGSQKKIGIIGSFDNDLPQGYKIKHIATDFYTHANNIDSKSTLNFRKNELAAESKWKKHKKMLNLVLVAACLLPIALLAVIYFQANAYRNIAKQNRFKQNDIFAALYPNEKPPANIRIALQEKIKSKNINADKKLSAKYKYNVLQVLQQAAKNFPKHKKKINIKSIDLSGNRIEIEGIASNDSVLSKLEKDLTMSKFSVLPYSSTPVNSMQALRKMSIKATYNFQEGEHE